MVVWSRPGVIIVPGTNVTKVVEENETLAENSDGWTAMVNG
jgi:hypothetical protein